MVYNDTATSTVYSCSNGQVSAQTAACSKTEEICALQACCSGLSCKSYYVQAQAGGTSYTLKKCCAPSDCLGPNATGIWGCIANGQTLMNNQCVAGTLQHVPLRVSNILMVDTTDACELVVYIFYNLDVDPSSARNPSNYHISDALDITATGSLGKNSVFLRMSNAWASNHNYVITINHVKDSTGVEIPANTVTNFNSPMLRQCS